MEVTFEFTEKEMVNLYSRNPGQLPYTAIENYVAETLQNENPGKKIFYSITTYIKEDPTSFKKVCIVHVTYAACEIDQPFQEDVTEGKQTCDYCGKIHTKLNCPHCGAPGKL